MSKLDEILRKRLERIREDINTYIASHHFSGEHKLVIPPPPPMSESIREEVVREDQNHGGMQEKFRNYTKLYAEDSDESDYQEDYQDEASESISESFTIETAGGAAPKRLAAYSPNATRREPAPEDMEYSKKVPNPPTLFQRAQVSPPMSNHVSPSFGKRLDLDQVLEQKEESFSEMLLRLIDEKNLKDSDVYKRANIDRRLFSKIRGDEDYVPSKKTAISFCLALELEMDEAKKLLATAGYTLSASSRFDLIIMYLIENCEYNVHFANIVLDDYGEGTLSR